MTKRETMIQKLTIQMRKKNFFQMKRAAQRQGTTPSKLVRSLLFGN